MNILEALEFPVIFRSWIYQCVSLLNYSFFLNGELVGFFPWKKGIRQGDPISSSLFVLVMDLLPRDLDLAMRNDVFKPHPLCLDPLITHLSFADDVFIFFNNQRGL